MNVIRYFLIPALLSGALGFGFAGCPSASLICLVLAVFVAWYHLVTKRSPDGSRMGVLLTTFILVGAMLFAGTRTEALADDPPQDPQEIAWVPVCLGLVVLVVGAVVIYQLVKTCKKLLPPTEPPPPPPGTNAPPRYDGPIARGPTIDRPTFTFDDSAWAACDVSAYGTNVAWQGPDGLPYEALMETKYRWSTNAVDWVTNQIRLYVSPTFILSSDGVTHSLSPRNMRPVIGPETPAADMVLFQPLTP